MLRGEAHSASRQVRAQSPPTSASYLRSILGLHTKYMEAVLIVSASRGRPPSVGYRQTDDIWYLCSYYENPIDRVCQALANLFIYFKYIPSRYVLIYWYLYNVFNHIFPRHWNYVSYIMAICRYCIFEVTRLLLQGGSFQNMETVRSVEPENIAASWGATIFNFLDSY
jgi:hypothetical protein